ncbi:MAG TPA: helix-turn-helix domain-containing protein [Kineosporiaceae bacterium]
MAVSKEVAGLLAAFQDGVPSAACPTRTVLDHVTSRWGVLVLLALARGTLRWGQLRRAVQGVSEKMLAQTLQTLERDGLVHREALPVIPPHVEYSLTPLGDDLVAQLAPLMAWIAEHADEIVARWPPRP